MSKRLQTRLLRRILGVKHLTQTLVCTMDNLEFLVLGKEIKLHLLGEDVEWIEDESIYEKSRFPDWIHDETISVRTGVVYLPIELAPFEHSNPDPISVYLCFYHMPAFLPYCKVV